MSLTEVDSLMKSGGINSHSYNNNVEDDDLYSGYDTVPPEYNINDLVEDEEFQEALRTVTWGKRSVTPKPPGTGFRAGTAYSRAATGMDLRPKTGRLNVNSAIRPPTAVKGAGYTSSARTYDPYNKSPKVLGILSESPKEETPQMKFKNMERKIMRLLEDCYKTCATKPRSNNRAKGRSTPPLPDYSATLAKAREASTLERALIRMQEEIGHKDHNFDLTYAVLYNMAMQYAFNEMYEEALNAYTLMTKNKVFANSSRLKMNMGNIYYKIGQYKKAVKCYHMALDQVPSTQKELRLKIMHNLAATFVTVGQYQEAAINLEYIMTEKGDIKSGLRLVLCYYALEDVPKMKIAFKKLLNVDLDLLDTDSYIDPIVDPDLTILKDVILSDEMSELEKKIKNDAEHCICLAAKVIAPVIEESYIDGYNWCVDSLKESYYGILANELEMNNAITFLKRNDIPHAIETLKAFEKKEDKVAYTAAVNLSFVAYLEGNYELAAKYTNQAKKLDSYQSAAYVNQGALYLIQGNLADAKEEFRTALSNDAGCIEAIYNLGLIYKFDREYDDALDCFRRLEVLYGSDPTSQLLYQLGHLYELKNDSDAANECYMQVIGLEPTDPSVFKRMAEMFAKDNDKQQAFNYMTDSYRYYSGNLEVINWLGSYHIEEQQAERAFLYFERAAMASPNVAKWYLLSASCYKKTGNFQQALVLYTRIHKKFPENIECLKSLIEMCSSQGLKEAEYYANELKRVEKSKEARERIGSARPGSRRTALSMSGHSTSIDSAHSNTKHRFNQDVSRNIMNNVSHERIRTGDIENMSLNKLEYDDPLGSPPDRPCTVVKFGIGDTFINQDLGDDLLPT